MNFLCDILFGFRQHFEGLAGSKMIQEKYVSDENLPLLIPDEVRNQM